jgi:hypothetical protein
VPIICLAPDENTMSAEKTRAAQKQTAEAVQKGVQKAVAMFEDIRKRESTHSSTATLHYKVLEPANPILSPETEEGRREDWALLAHWSVKGHSKVPSCVILRVRACELR